MRVKSVIAQNFASYKDLEFNFENQGLTLIQGATGSGKSTLCDIVPWILFGITSKGGKVDEIRSWNTAKPTVGTLYLEDGLEITRVRGAAKDNDLYFLYENDTGTVSAQRGKDIPDTQRLINQLLGIDADIYLTGAYYHEFSHTAQFFTTTAKNRRAICEQLVDLSLATKLQVKLVEKRNFQAKELAKLNKQIHTITSNIELLRRLQETENNKADCWTRTHIQNKKLAVANYDRFELNRKKIIQNKCNACGTQLKQPQEIIDDSENPYARKLADLEQETNPYTSGAKDYTNEIAHKAKELQQTEKLLSALNAELDELEVLQIAIQDYRSLSISNTIAGVEDKTNQLLTDYFDAEIKVTFTAEYADKLDISITKNGNVASYTQLSKGQRCLLKLCFGVSIIEAAQNYLDINVSQIFFDEALDGLSEEFKVKAYRLLETIALDYESVFVVEHSQELKSLFISKYSVELVNGRSKIEQG